MKAFIDENKELLLSAETPEEQAMLDQWKNQTPRVSNIHRRLEQGVVGITIKFTSGQQ